MTVGRERRMTIEELAAMIDRELLALHHRLDDELRGVATRADLFESEMRLTNLVERYLND